MKKHQFIAAALAVVLTSAAHAEDAQRYTIMRSDDGYVRTDTKTGAISTCTEQGDQLVCRMAADDRQAYEADIAALQTKIDSLEQRVSVLEKTGLPDAGPTAPLGDEKEFQTSLDRMEQFFRRFMGIVKEFQAFGGDTQPSPDRT